MKPVHQTKFGKPDGNCFAACIASILEVSIDDVPHFMGKDWQERWNAFLANFHLGLFCIALPEGTAPPGWSILSGVSPRAKALGEEWLHSVVAFNGVVEHDPHPEGGGVLSTADWIIFQALDPSRAAVARVGD